MTNYLAREQAERIERMWRDWPECENANVYVVTGVDPGPCSEDCPKHGKAARQ
jgi:hypothetical protein